MASGLLSDRAARWVAWAVNVGLSLEPDLQARHVQQIVAPSFDTDLIEVLEWWPPVLHPLIVERVLHEAEHANSWSDPESPPPTNPNRWR